MKGQSFCSALLLSKGVCGQVNKRGNDVAKESNLIQEFQ